LNAKRAFGNRQSPGDLGSIGRLSTSTQRRRTVGGAPLFFTDLCIRRSLIGRGEATASRLQHIRLVGLELEQVIVFALDDDFGQIPLTIQGIARQKRQRGMLVSNSSAKCALSTSGSVLLSPASGQLPRRQLEILSEYIEHRDRMPARRALALSSSHPPGHQLRLTAQMPCSHPEKALLELRQRKPGQRAFEGGVARRLAHGREPSGLNATHPNDAPPSGEWPQTR